MTLANQLTLARACLGLLTFLCLWTKHPPYFVLALLLYTAAVLTDWIDGYIARKTHSVSLFGAMADPVADKVLVLGALIAFLHIGSLHIPSWAVFLMVVRELVVGGLRALAGAQGKMLSAERWGKWKMGVQSLSVLAILTLLVARDAWLVPIPPWAQRSPSALVLLSLAVTWLSAVVYLRQNRQMLRQSWSPPSRTGHP